jgi:hypothetical protein
MHHRRVIVSLCLAAAALAGCGGDPTEAQLWGTGAGAVAGGGIGRAVAIGTHYPWAFTGAGLAAGAVVGYAIGDHIDPPASRMWAAATVTAAETGEATHWATGGHRGQVTATGPAWTDAGGRLCRPLRQDAGPAESAVVGFSRAVVACRLADGSWEVTVPDPVLDPTLATPG